MRTADIRGQGAGVEWISTDGAEVYFSSETRTSAGVSLSLQVYQAETGEVRTVASGIAIPPEDVCTFFDFPEETVLVMSGGESEAVVSRVSKESGAETARAHLQFFGNLYGCLALDETRLLLITEENEAHRKVFQKYRELTGFSRILFLYDMKDQQYYYLKDPRLCGLCAEQFRIYDLNGQRQLLILQTYGSESEKRYCYRNRKYMEEEIRDDIWICPLIDFVISVKSGEAHLPLEPVMGSGTNGMLRYAGIDAASLYFRATYFPTGDQRICAVDKTTREVTALLELNGEAEAVRYLVDADTARVYCIRDRGDVYEVEGLLNTGDCFSYPRELGTMLACVDGRYIVTQVEDGKGGFYLCDTVTSVSERRFCRFSVQDGTLVLY